MARKPEQIRIELDPIANFIARLNSPDAALLGGIVDALNDSSPRDPSIDYRPELRRILAIWNASGPNLANMLDSHPEIQQQIKKGRAQFISTSTGRAYCRFAFTDYSTRDHFACAIADFCLIILSPEWWKFGGPCHQCGKYFLRPTQTRTPFCSEVCNRRYTAKRDQERERQKKREVKIAVAEQAIAKFKMLKRPPKDWKKYVAGWEPSAGITPKFLTRHVKNGLLQEPTNPRKENSQ